MKMTAPRFEELLGRLLDAELSEAESAELCRGVAADEALLRDLRGHLVLWDLWSQERTSGRDAAAFLHSFQTRLAAEAEDDLFSAATVRRIAAETPSRRRAVGPRTLAACLLVAAMLGAWWALDPSRQLKNAAPSVAIKPAPPVEEGRYVQVRGELVCAMCALQRADVHMAAIRINDAEGDDVVFISRETAARDLNGETFCAKPAPVIAEGHIRQINNRPELFATRLEILRR